MSALGLLKDFNSTKSFLLMLDTEFLAFSKAGKAYANYSFM